MWTAETVKRPGQQPAQPQYANYWAPLTRKRHILPHSAQPQHTNHGAPRTRKRHQQEHRPQRPTESSNPTQHAEGRTGDRPGPRKDTTTKRNVTREGPPPAAAVLQSPCPAGFLLGTAVRLLAARAVLRRVPRGPCITPPPPPRPSRMDQGRAGMGSGLCLVAG